MAYQDIVIMTLIRDMEVKWSAQDTNASSDAPECWSIEPTVPTNRRHPRRRPARLVPGVPGRSRHAKTLGAHHEGLSPGLRRDSDTDRRRARTGGRHAPACDFHRP